MQAKAIAMTIYLYCPHCEEAAQDENGSYQITSDSFRSDKVKCLECGKTFTMPKTARLFA